MSRYLHNEILFHTSYQYLAKCQKIFELARLLGKIEVMGAELLRKYSDEWFLSLYLMYGSVEESFRSYQEPLPISIANFHRLVKRYGLIKSAGRHVSLPETLHFFHKKAMSPGMPLERVYKQMPLSFQTSLSTLHRIYQYMEKNAVRRHATALIITPEEDNTQVLLGSEVFGNSRYGKRIGDYSIPMSFSKADEPNFTSVLRVLQQEVFSAIAQKGNLKATSPLAQELIEQNPEPIFYFDIVDVRVKAFHLSIPRNMEGWLRSYKLINHHFRSINDLSLPLRAGVNEMVDIYSGHLYNPYTVKPIAYAVSSINQMSLAKI